MRQAGEVVVARFRRQIVLERLKVVILTFQVFVLVIAQRLAVSAGLMCATMSNKTKLAFCLFDWVAASEGMTYWARLSEREKALLHNGQTYGRS